MIHLNIEKGAAKCLMIGLIVLVTGLCYFLTIGDPDCLDAIRNRIYPDAEYFKSHPPKDTP